jgi:hypothetical protein
MVGESRLMLETVAGPGGEQTAQQFLTWALLRGHSPHPSEAGRERGSFRRGQSLKYFIEFVTLASSVGRDSRR